MYEFHPVANIFPMMDKTAFDELCRDIKSNGLIEPIWLHDGQIIDGRNRYLACRETGVDARFREWEGNGSLVSFVVSLNLNRRHLSQSQKAAIGLSIVPMLEAEAKERQRAGGGDHGNQHTGGKLAVVAGMRQVAEPNRSSEEAAELMGVSPRYMQEIKAIAKEAPEKIADIQEGKTTVNKEYMALKKKQPKEVKSIEEIHRPPTPCTEAMQFAVIAISQLTRIRQDDPQKVAALQRVKNYINEQLGE